MRKIYLLPAFALATLLVQFFLSCECLSVDCASDDLTVQFLSKIDDSDLFENGTYQRDSLQFFVRQGSVTSDYSHQLYNWQTGEYPLEYPLTVHIFRDASDYVFQFNSQERDTLNISFTVSEGGSRCCSGVARVTYGLFKGDTIYPNASGYLILKK
ncbi:MAG TPA: hypothetical protein PK228_20395 [Saprospiraceae bacterium]|nr:hypothetical protein [Saprospiraceae bacterium]